jgi:hypothetical protein
MSDGKTAQNVTRIRTDITKGTYWVPSAEHFFETHASSLRTTTYMFNVQPENKVQHHTPTSTTEHIHQTEEMASTKPTMSMRSMHQLLLPDVSSALLFLAKRSSQRRRDYHPRVAHFFSSHAPFRVGLRTSEEKLQCRKDALQG